jgi:hypothetical protein
MVYFIICVLLTFIAFIELSLFIYLGEYMTCVVIKHQPPFVATSMSVQRKLVKYIQEHYKDVKLICEIGSGYDDMARYIGQKTGASVIALENMPLSAFISKTKDLFQKKSQTIKCDAFDYLKKTQKKFDLAIAYLSPKHTTKLLQFKSKFRTLISLDFEIENYKPTKIIDCGPGFTTFNHKKYPHKMFIYEF